MSGFGHRRVCADDSGAGSPFRTRVAAAATQNEPFHAVASRFTSAAGDAPEEGDELAACRREQRRVRSCRPEGGLDRSRHEGTFFEASQV